VGAYSAPRRDLLEHDLRAFDGEPERKRQRQMRSLRHAIKKLDNAQTRLVRKLEVDDDPEGILFRRVRERLSELEQERLLKIKELEPWKPSSSKPNPERSSSWMNSRSARICSRPPQTMSSVNSFRPSVSKSALTSHHIARTAR